MKEDAMLKRPWIVPTGYYMLWLWLLSIPALPAITIWWESPEGIIGGLLLEGGKGETMVAAFVVWLALFWFPLGLILYDVGKGRNWARIIFLIVLLLGAPFSLQRIMRDSGHSSFPHQLCAIFQLEIQIVAVVLLFHRSSSFKLWLWYSCFTGLPRIGSRP